LRISSADRPAHHPQPRPPDERRATINDFAVHLDLVDLSLGTAPFNHTSAAGSKKRLRRNLSILAFSFVAIRLVLIMVALMMTQAEDDIQAATAPAGRTSGTGAQAAQTQPTTKPTKPAESTTTGDCILPAFAVTVTSLDPYSDVGVSDPSMFQKTWTTDIQNTTKRSVVLAVQAKSLPVEVPSIR
jgi:hypothetical protein